MHGVLEHGHARSTRPCSSDGRARTMDALRPLDALDGRRGELAADLERLDVTRAALATTLERDEAELAFLTKIAALPPPPSCTHSPPSLRSFPRAWYGCSARPESRRAACARADQERG